MGSYRVIHVRLDTGKAQPLEFGSTDELLGGSHLAAALFEQFGKPGQPWNDPGQPLIFAVGPLTGYFPLMSKVVAGFVSPVHNQYAESHAGGRLALAMKFAGADAVVFTGRAAQLSCAVVGRRGMALHDVHYLRGMDVPSAGRHLRKVAEGHSGHRSMLRIGPAGELSSAYACITVDTYRHFGRMGSGAVMGSKNLKAVVVQGDGAFALPEGKAYAALFRDIYKQMTATPMMSKYHDLGTPQNLVPLNELKSLPWRNLQATSDPAVAGISGERFAKDLLLRNAACAGCPVGCIHVGMLREQFADEHRFKYRQVAYDYEPIFSLGTMLGVTDASQVLAILDEVEKVGLDCMSAGVALAWATEAFQKGLVGLDETLTPLEFGDAEAYKAAMNLLGRQEGAFYATLAQGALPAARQYGGEDFACVLGQEMAGYATGEVYVAQQSMSFRHAHLDAGGYSFDQTAKDKDAAKAVDYLVKDEKDRCLLTGMVSCLFARGVYKPEIMAQCLESIGLSAMAGRLDDLAGACQRLRWRMRLACGYDPDKTKVPKRFTEVVTWKGPMDVAYLEELRGRYAAAIRELGGPSVGKS